MLSHTRWRKFQTQGLGKFIGEFTILSGIYQVSLRFAAWAVIGIVILLVMRARGREAWLTKAGEEMADLAPDAEAETNPPTTRAVGALVSSGAHR